MSNRKGSINSAVNHTDSLIRDILPKVDFNEESFEKEEDISDKSIDFNEFSDEIFNAPSESSQIEFNRHNEGKAQTMKMNHTMLSKNANKFNMDLYNNNMIYNNFHRQKNFKTVSPMNNNTIINNMYTNMYNTKPFNFYYNNSSFNTTFSSTQNNNMTQYNDSSIFENNNQTKYIRNNIINKTYNNNMYNSTFYVDFNNRNSKHSSTFNPHYKRFQTTMPSHKNVIPWEIELFLNELEIALNRTGCIDSNIYSSIQSKLQILIKTQLGSRILQNYLCQSSQQILNQIYHDIYDDLNVLFLDPYANYFCLKLFCCLETDERLSFIIAILPNIITFSMNKVATYPIQCIIGSLSSQKEKELIMHTINPHIKTLILDIYGTHVIEKILMCLEREHCLLIKQFIIDNYVYLANHMNGLCLAKKILMLEYKKEHFNTLRQILIDHCLDLIENPYGNYALQIVIDYWNNEDIIDIFAKIYDHCTKLSMMKYSSNVIERCIQKSEIFVNNFINEICNKYHSVGMLIKDNYGNYVIQTALKTAKGGVKVRLINEIESNINILGEKKLINKWKSILAANILECVNNE